MVRGPWLLLGRQYRKDRLEAGIDAVAQVFSAEGSIGIGQESVSDDALDILLAERLRIRRFAVALHIGPLATSGRTIFRVGPLRLESFGARRADGRLCPTLSIFFVGLVMGTLARIFDLSLFFF